MPTVLSDWRQMHMVFNAVLQAMAQPRRCSEMVEKFDTRLRNYFTLRGQLEGEYLGVLQFILNQHISTQQSSGGGW